MYNVTFTRVHVTILAVEKKKNIIYSECMFVALLNQNAKLFSTVLSCLFERSHEA
jgi:hypothetical protein